MDGISKIKMIDKFFDKYRKIITFVSLLKDSDEVILYADFKKTVNKFKGDICRLKRELDDWKRIAHKKTQAHKK